MKDEPSDGLYVSDGFEDFDAVDRAESSLAAALLLEPGEDHAEALASARAIVDSGMFRSRALGFVFGATSRIRDRNESVDLIGVYRELELVGQLEDVGLDLIGELVGLVPTTALVEQHARIVRDAALRRRYRAALDLGLRDVNEPGKSVGELLAAQDERTEALRGSLAVAEARIPTLADILEDPSVLEPPSVVVPRLGWAGRVTLLVAREKVGKSTLLSAAIAAKTAGLRIFGEAPDPGPVLVFGLEEHVGDLARRLVDFGAEPTTVYVVDRSTDPFLQLERAIEVCKPTLTVIDTLAAFTQPLELDPGASTDWGPAMSRIMRPVRDSGTGLILAAHGRKADGEYRDSSAIGAGVDAIITMTKGDTDGVRKFSCVGRWSLEDFEARLVSADDGRPAYFEKIVSGELGVDAQVLIFLEHHPGASKRAVRDGVRGRAKDIDAAVFRLLRGGAIRDQGTDNRASFHVSPQDPHGRGPDAVGTHLGRGVQDNGAAACPEGGESLRDSPRDAHPALELGLVTDPTDVLEGTS